MEFIVRLANDKYKERKMNEINTFSGAVEALINEYLKPSIKILEPWQELRE